MVGEGSDAMALVPFQPTEAGGNGRALAALPESGTAPTGVSGALTGNNAYERGGRFKTTEWTTGWVTESATGSDPL